MTRRYVGAKILLTILLLTFIFSVGIAHAETIEEDVDINVKMDDKKEEKKRVKD